MGVSVANNQPTGKDEVAVIHLSPIINISW